MGRAVLQVVTMPGIVAARPIIRHARRLNQSLRAVARKSSEKCLMPQQEGLGV